MPVPSGTISRDLLVMQQSNVVVVDNVHKNRNGPNDGESGGRRLKRNKTFTAHNGRPQPQLPTPGNGGRRHRRGTKGRYTVPLFSAPPSPAVNHNKQPMDQQHPKLGPLYIQTSDGIFEEAFGDGKRNSLNQTQIEQLTRALALPEQCARQQKLHQQQQQEQLVSPTTVRSTTSSSGFGSSVASITSSKDASPRSTTADEEHTPPTSIKKVHPFHFWIFLCIQYMVYYLRQISDTTRRRLETTPIRNTTERIVDAQPLLLKKFLAPVLRKDQGSRNHRRASRTKRKLQFEDEIDDQERRFNKSKPFYTELHLGRENQRHTSLAAIEAAQSEYPTEKLITRATETKFVTTVFEVRLRGLEEISGSVRDEMQRWYGEHDDDLIIVCCEMQWSTPDRYRNIHAETRMKDDVMECLRRNNKRVLNIVADRNESIARKKSASSNNNSGKFDQCLILPDAVTEEVAGRRPGAMRCWGGSYRRYYDGLLPRAHNEAAVEHEPWWQFKKHSMPESIDWPLIASVEKTSFIMLNMVCLKLNQL